MKQDYSTGTEEFEQPKFDKVNWKLILIGLNIIGLIALCIMAIKIEGLIFYLGCAVFFALGFTLGQSRVWQMIRRIWGETQSEPEDKE